MDDELVRRILRFRQRIREVPTLIHGTNPAGQAESTQTFRNPMNAEGQMVRGGAGGAPVRIPRGEAGEAIVFDENRIPRPMPTQAVMPPGQRGDLLYHTGTIWSRLPIGDEGEVLTVINGLPQWWEFTGELTPPDVDPWPAGTVTLHGEPVVLDGDYVVITPE